MNNDKITDEEIDALDNVDLLELGQNFLGKGDGQRALKCFLRAAEPDKSRIGKIIGLSTAAEIYRDGLGGVPVDGHKAIDLYKKLGGYDSDLCVAEIYAKGCGEVVADGYKALEIYREMIRSIEILAQSRWNICGDSGVEFAVTEDYLGSDYPYYIQALLGQAIIYLYGLGGVPVDAHKAIELYQKIGDRDSYFKIAEIYKIGYGEIVADGYKALEIYREMIRSIEVLAQSRWNICGDSDVEFTVTEDYLGSDYPDYIEALRGQAEIYRFGTGGVPVDAHKAIELYKKVGDRDSYFKIAEIYEDGCGNLLADGYKALEIYREMVRSIESLVHCGDSGVEFAVTKDYLGSDYLDYIEALRGQAIIYLYGIGGVPVDAHKAI
ncbi:MAG: sel1 repeat family protein, partial [Selenomonadaceae bacterium]|nr:sel1 repeat family protein [Selenomonadaceae bacterium]